MEKAIGGLRKLKLYNQDSYANTNFYVIESHKNFFPLFYKIIVMDWTSYENSFEKFMDKPPKDMSEVKDLIYNFGVRFQPKIKIIFGTERIILVFFNEDKVKIDNQLKSMINFSTLKENLIKNDSF